MMHFVTLNSPAAAQATDTTATVPPTCATGTAEAFLDVGNVRAKILNNGGLFWNGDDGVYEVPKYGGVHSIFAASLWLGGMVEDELRVAATRFGPREFWPGPIAGDTPSPELCAEFDRIWEVNAGDLNEYSEAEQRVQTWPVASGAPFIDVDGNRVYEPEEGDRPELLGDQQLWWIMNDASGPHVETESDPIGVEIRATTFAFNVSGAVGNSTFYKYRIRNASAHPIKGTYAGLFMDSDLGAAFDDYVGSDTTLGLGYFYNADNDDDGAYGAAPPAIGFTVLVRPHSVLTAGSSCNYPDEKSFGFTNSMIPDFRGGIIGYDPDLEDYYYAMQSRHRNGQPLTMGGNGRDFSQSPTRFMFPGDPVTGSFWSEVNYDDVGTPMTPADRRLLNSLGPFCMAPGEEVELVVAIVWSRGSDHLDSVRQLREDVAYIQSIRDAILTPRALPGRQAGEQESGPELPFAAAVYPNPAGPDGVTVRFSTPEPLELGVDVFNAIGQRVFVAAEPGVVDAGDYSWTLPTATWPPGLYLVRITAGHAVTTRRLVVSGAH